MEVNKLNEELLKKVLDGCKTQDYKKAVKLVDSGDVRFVYTICAFLFPNDEPVGYKFNGFETARDVFNRLDAMYKNTIEIYMSGIVVDGDELIQVTWDETDDIRPLQDEKFNLI